LSERRFTLLAFGYAALMAGVAVYNIVGRVLGGVGWTVVCLVLATIGLLSVPLRRFADRLVKRS
jgi:hypothetical protein